METNSQWVRFVINKSNFINGTWWKYWGFHEQGFRHKDDGTSFQDSLYIYSSGHIIPGDAENAFYDFNW